MSHFDKLSVTVCAKGFLAVLKPIAVLNTVVVLKWRHLSQGAKCLKWEKLLSAWGKRWPVM